MQYKKKFSNIPAGADEDTVIESVSVNAFVKKFTTPSLHSLLL